MTRENFRLLVLSILFHTIVYSSFLNMVSFIFFGKILSTIVTIQLIIALLMILSFWYFDRYYHVKNIYTAYGQYGKSEIDKFFISWFFVG